MTTAPRMVTHIRGDVHDTPPVTDLMGDVWQPQRYRYCSVIDQTEVTWLRDPTPWGNMEDEHGRTPVQA